jgi:hypothetical protein
MKVFSMLPSVAGSERAWSSMSFIHSKARNRLKTEKTQKLAYLHINLKLKMKNGYYTQNELDLAHLLNNAMMVDAEEKVLVVTFCLTMRMDSRSTFLQIMKFRILTRVMSHLRKNE